MQNRDIISTLESRSRVAIAILSLMCFVCVLLAIDGFMLAEGEILLSYEAWMVLRIGGAIACAISFVAWSYRAHANLRVLGRDGLRHADEATIWWWLAPFANLFMPFRVVYETVRGSTAPLANSNWRATPLDPAAGWWTGLFIAGLLIERWADAMVNAALYLEDLVGPLQLSGFSYLVLAGAAAAAVIMINRVTTAQATRFGEMSTEVQRRNHAEDLRRSEGDPAQSGAADAEMSSASVSGPGEAGYRSDPTVSVRQAAFCTHCGVRFQGDDDRFCPSCGSPRRAGEPASRG
ncbi:MAG TPA: DUF4328 domain-containing protein [Acidimicrobiia bacterium]